MPQHQTTTFLKQALAASLAVSLLSVVGNMAQTMHNIQAHPGLFFATFLAYFSSFVCDIVIAWGLYFLLKPVNPALSLLAAWFQLVYAAVGLSVLFNLVTVLRLVHRPRNTLPCWVRLPCKPKWGFCWRLRVWAT